MDQQVELKTKTSSIVFTTMLTLAAFFAVAATGFALLYTNSLQESDSTTNTSTTTVQAFRAKDIDKMTVSFNWPSVEVKNGDVIFSTFDTNGDPIDALFTYDYSEGRYDQYTDGISLTNSAPLMVRVLSASHPAMLISTRVLTSPTASSYVSKGICLPEVPYTCSNGILDGDETAIDCGGAQCPSCSSGRGPLGIPIAQAALIDENFNGGGEGSGEARYYIDTEGNTYLDSALSQKANTVNCSDTIAKAFSPKDVSNVSFSKPFNTGGYYTTFAESWGLIYYGSYETTLGYEDSGVTDTRDSLAPFYMIGAIGNGVSTPEMTATVTYDAGSKNLCVPQLSGQVGNWDLYALFYDKDGKPYSDVFLQNRISCGSSNACNSVTCAKQPNSLCCKFSSPVN